MKKKSFLFLAFALSCVLIFSANDKFLYADDVQNINYIERGFNRILTGAFQLPIYLVQKTLSGPLVLGTIDGAVQGTFYTISTLTGGIFDIARGTVPYGKYMLFFL